MSDQIGEDLPPFTVGTLIEELKKHDSSALVGIFDPEKGTYWRCYIVTPGQEVYELHEPSGEERSVVGVGLG